MDDVIEFAKRYNNEPRAIIVFSEKELSSNTCTELFNLALITGKLGKTGSGLISLKEKNNAQGLFDMGVCMAYGVGGVPITDEKQRKKLRKTWKVSSEVAESWIPSKDLPSPCASDIYEDLEDGRLKNIFIFGEDPLGCTSHKVQTAGWLTIADFVVVQDYFMTETAKHAHLILPASLPVETGGTFINTQKMIQSFRAEFKPAVEKTGLEQLADLLKALGVAQKAEYHEALSEAMSLLPEKSENVTHPFNHTVEDNQNRLYDHGCDHIVMRFDNEFARAFENVKIDLYERV